MCNNSNKNAMRQIKFRKNRNYSNQNNNIKLIFIKKTLFHIKKFGDKLKQQLKTESKKTKKKRSTFFVSFSIIIIFLNITMRRVPNIRRASGRWCSSLLVKKVVRKLIKRVIGLKRKIELIATIHSKYVNKDPREETPEQ